MSASDLQSATPVHASFERLSEHRLAALEMEMVSYRHRATGARHYHIQADSQENAFLVAFPTVPMDSTGVAHILEHTALCGSERYPVRDPFFMMIRRSLNTFMNAMTSSDWTAYPFASQNRKDYFNLLDVYLDAVFFSRLDPLDFAQEGHRLEFERPGDPDTPLVYRGVVYNEMKGAMSSVTSQLWQGLCRHLYPTTTYHFNSGGEPDCIPQLTYAQLQRFYRSHYHPSNAIFMTFGDLPAHALQARFEANALHRFEAREIDLALHDEQRYFAPIEVLEHYPVDERTEAPQAHVVVGWLLGRCTHLDDVLEARLLATVLLDHSASPLTRLLETSTLGNSPSPLCGVEDSHREIVFVCGLEGAEAHNAAAIEAEVLGLLRDLADQGVEPSTLEAALHQLEISQREIGGDGYPFGLQLLLSSLSAAVHGGDPGERLDLDPALERLRKQIQDPAYFPDLVRKLLLDNQHRVRLTFAPEPQISARRDAAQQAQLEHIKSALGAAEIEQLVRQAAALEARQAQTDDPDILPKVTLEDVPEQVIQPSPEQVFTGPSGVRSTLYQTGTNGLVYAQWILSLPELDDDLVELLPLYTLLLSEVGLGEDDYLEVQRLQSQHTGGLSVFTSMRSSVDDEQHLGAYLVVSGKSLGRNSNALAALLDRTLEEPRFDEQARILDLISQARASRERSVTGQGHSLAMMAAVGGMSPLARLHHEQTGLEGIRRLKSLDQLLKHDAQAASDLTERLQRLHQCIAGAPRQRLCVCDAESADRVLGQWHQLSSSSAHTPTDAPFAAFDPVAIREARNELWVANTQVNFCARAYPTVPVGHPDSAALTVLGGFLRNGFLHSAIRERGGAYGAGAGQDANVAAFRLFSYRDPRLEETLRDFDRAIDWVLSDRHAWQPVEEAILGAIGGIDKPGSPAGEAKRDFFNRLHGREQDHIQRVRASILAVKLADLQRVTETYLQPKNASTAVLSYGDTAARAADSLRLRLQRL
ncbi:MAG: insulinase family protein [Pseudomonadota bacterium]|nr:insulinase family protein [Pseudomonadota bacterium]